MDAAKIVALLDVEEGTRHMPTLKAIHDEALKELHDINAELIDKPAPVPTRALPKGTEFVEDPVRVRPGPIPDFSTEPALRKPVEDKPADRRL